MTDSAAAERATILYSAYPIHLFANAGYYYCWELGARYDIVLLVERGCEDHPAIRTLLAHGRITRIVTMPTTSHPYALHRWAARDAGRLIATIRPVAVVQSNFQYYFNKYLFRNAARLIPGTARIVVLSCQILLDVSLEQALREVDGIALASARRRCPLLPDGLIRPMRRARGRYRLWRDFTLLPLLLTGRRLHATLDEAGARVLSRDTRGLVDRLLCYTPGERDGYAMETDDRDAIELVRHPFTTVPEARAALYPGAVRGETIVALPSRCFDFAQVRVDSVATHAARIAGLWRERLAAIRARTGGGAIVWKLHPAHADEPLMAQVTRLLVDTLDDFTVAPTGESAERLMMSAGAVVGDTSTALIWASRLGDRPVFSLDIFGVSGGGEMRHYPGITLVREGEGAGEARPAPAAAAPPACPTVTQMFDRILSEVAGEARHAAR